MPKEKKKKTGRARRVKRNVPEARISIKSTFNNTIVTLSDLEGNVLGWASAGTRGYKGTKKGTAFAAQLAAEEVCRIARDCGVRDVTIYTKGPGSGKEAAVRTIAGQGLRVKLIKDVTPVPHNGCRPKKKRRV